MATAKAATGKGKPVCVLLKTMMGNGVDFMMHTHAWHGKAPNDAVRKCFKSESRNFRRLLISKPT